MNLFRNSLSATESVKCPGRCFPKRLNELNLSNKFKASHVSFEKLKRFVVLLLYLYLIAIYFRKKC